MSSLQACEIEFVVSQFGIKDYYGVIDTPNSFGESLAKCGNVIPKGVLLPVDEIRPTLNEEILTKMSTACEEAGTKTVVS